MDWPRPPSPDRRRLSAALDRLSLAVQRRFAIDPRALAAFRIAIGTLLCLDLLRRARSLEMFYTDAGVLPREALFSDYGTVYSLHAVSGEVWGQGVLFALAGAFALALVVGYRTRIATVASWLLLLSLHARNPMVLNGGDTLLRMLLFWAIFLPLGTRWAVDARRVARDWGENGNEPNEDESNEDESNGDEPNATITTVGTMAILLQVQLVYVTNAVHKARSDVWMNGEAVGQIFQADHLTILLGNALADQPMVLRAFTYAWMALILLSPLLLVLTGRGRAAFASLFVGMHLGMFASLRIDLFPLISVAGLLLFYPPVVWDTATAAAARAGLAEPLRSEFERLQRGVPRVPVPAPMLDAPNVPAVSDVPTAIRNALSAAYSRGRVLFSTVLPWFVLFLVVLSNAEAVDYAEIPDPGDEVLETINADQSWRMFAPDPTSEAKWLVVPGELEDGTEVDVRHGGAVDWDRPPNVEETYATSRERKYVSKMRYADNENHRSYYANYLCERWNRTHETVLERLTIYGLTDRAGPTDDEPDVLEFELLAYDCGDAFVQNG